MSAAPSWIPEDLGQLWLVWGHHYRPYMYRWSCIHGNRPNSGGRPDFWSKKKSPTWNCFSLNDGQWWKYILLIFFLNFSILTSKMLACIGDGMLPFCFTFKHFFVSILLLMKIAPHFLGSWTTASFLAPATNPIWQASFVLLTAIHTIAEMTQGN